MGVPKFYRWISERYPCLSEVVKEMQLPEFDNLYLDMNGIVHVCSHPEDDNPHFRITEEKIFKDICHYIEFLFRLIKPRKVFFMAIDGVAPRAKMNQQRGRRFRSAREAEELIRKAQEQGQTLPDEKRFDSNCITPGTPFMKRLQDHLKYFVVDKVTHDPLWQGPKIILSGHETPGEGEHKVMDYIRYARSQPDHDPNTRHCLYGLDADLIMLGLTSHEPHFALLREEVRFGGKKDRNKRPTSAEETTFHLLHLSLMREYLDYEFSPLKGKLPFEYDIEHIIDDWILMGFLVGNDFVPHLKDLHIKNDGLPLLWETYMKVLPTLDGYLNEGGRLNLPRFEKYMEELSHYDHQQFDEQFMDMKYLEGKRGGKGSGHNSQAAGGTGIQAKRKKRPGKAQGGENSFNLLQAFTDMDEEYDDKGNANSQLEARVMSGDIEADGNADHEDGNTFEAEFAQAKRSYYMLKMNYETVTPEVLRDQAYQYVLAIQWILLYYYDGVQSWSWYYPHHYAPYISDVRNFADMDLQFEMSVPFKPFEQLMAVLPAASKELLPPPLQELMTKQDSPVIDYYPVNFDTDLNGKQQDWEAVVLIPFIDERRLLTAMGEKEAFLTAEQRERNAHGPCYLYQYSTQQQGRYPSPDATAFSDVHISFAEISRLPKFHFCLAPQLIKKGLLPDMDLNVFFSGFPSLRHIPHKHKKEKGAVKVFQMPSRGENMMLYIADLPERRLEQIADDLLGKTVWVDWPHLKEAKVYAVADEKYRIELEEQQRKGQPPIQSFKRKDLNTVELKKLYNDASLIKEKYNNRFGVEVGKTTVVVFAGVMTGRKYVRTTGGRVSLEKQFSTRQTPYALQATCKDIATEPEEEVRFRTLEELFPTQAQVYMLANPHYGCQGEVLEVDNAEGRVRVSFTVPLEPNFSTVVQVQQLDDRHYMPPYVAAQRTGVSSHLLSRMTGTVLILRGDGMNMDSKANVGLNLKFTKRGEEVPGYTRKTDDGWKYSDKCVDVINTYFRTFPNMWDYILNSQTGGSDMYTENELFSEEGGTTLKEVLKFLEELPCAKVPTMKTGADIVSSMTIAAVEQAVEQVTEENKRKQKKVKMQVKSHLLYRPLPNQGTLEPDPGTVEHIQKLDRVVTVKLGFSVPFGRRGTVVGIHPGPTPQETMLDVLFDQEFAGATSLSEETTKKCGYRVPPVAVLNLSYGERKSSNAHTHPKGQASSQSPRTTTAQASSSAWQQSQKAQGQGQQGRHGHGHGHGQGQGQGQRQGQRSQGGGQRGQGSYSALVSREGSASFAPNGQSSGGFGMYGSSSQQPQFVTPKFASSSSPPKASRVPAPNMSTDNSDFQNLWNDLAAKSPLGPAKGAGNKGKAAPGNKNNSGSPRTQQGALLASAAQKLDKVAPPVMADLEEDEEPPTAILVDLSEASEEAGSTENKKEKSMRSERTAPGSKPKVFTNTNHQQKASGSQQKSNVMELFQNAEKARTGQYKKGSGKVGASKAATATSEQSPQHSPSEAETPVQGDKIAELMQQAQRLQAAQAGDPQAEFSSMLAALQVAPSSSATSTATTQPPAQPFHQASQDGSAALKQMLRIGQEGAEGEQQQQQQAAPEPQARQTYGRQVSLQELFDVAKQGPVQAKKEAGSADVRPYPHPTEQQHQAQPPRGPPHPLLPPAHLLPQPGMPRTNQRNPVDELAMLCQFAGQPLPKYDFNSNLKQKGFVSLVTLPAGARFEGSLCPSREEAAESAASVALSRLQQAQMRFPGHQGMPGWGQRPGPGMAPIRPGQRLFSPNSAFSPVTNPLMQFGPHMFNAPPHPGMMAPGQRGRQHVLSQPPPHFPQNRPHHHPPPHLNHRQPHNPSHHGPPNQAAHLRHANPNSHSEPKHVTSERAGDTAGELEKGKDQGSTPSKSSTEAFIPMQVTRKQRRKEDTPEKQVEGKERESTPKTNNHTVQSLFEQSPREAEKASENVASATLASKHSSAHTNGSVKQTSPSDPEKLVGQQRAKHEQTKEKKESTASEGNDNQGKGDGKVKKRKPRLAANFNFDSPK